MLQQAGQQNGPERLNVRGRGARLAGDVPPFSGPPTPTVPAPSGPLSAGRQEPGHDLVNPARADLITGISSNDPRERGGRRDRPTRHTRRESRSPGEDRRDSKRVPGDDERDAGYRDHRERKESRNEDRHSGREPGREMMAGGGRDGERERDREREQPSRRGDARERDGHDAPWTGSGGRGGRGRDMRDDRRDSRGARDDSEAGRKRKSDEGMGDRGHDKRARR